MTAHEQRRPFAHGLVIAAAAACGLADAAPPPKADAAEPAAAPASAAPPRQRITIVAPARSAPAASGAKAPSAAGHAPWHPGPLASAPRGAAAGSVLRRLKLETIRTIA